MRRATRNTPVGVGNEPLFIGSYAGSGEHFTGDLVELVIWPRALSDDEMRTVSDNACQSWPRLPHNTTESKASGYMPVREMLDPPEFSFQDWVVMQKDARRADLATDNPAPAGEAP